MLWKSCYIIWSFLWLLTLDQTHVSPGIICKPGEKATYSRDSCEPCPADQYNPKHSESKECRNCDPCGSYSDEVQPCTPTSNTKCRCLEGFTPWDETQKRCKCEIGSGIKNLGNGKMICEKCPPKTFSDKINSACQLLPQCIQSSEKIPGNATSDVNCGNEAKAVVPPSSPSPFSQTSSSTTTITPTTSTYPISTPTTSIPGPQDSKKHALWLASLAAFLLLILILKLSRCPKKRTDIVRQGSACGKPVEESGEKFFPPV
ncbi:tumor necrosis factor receptor superfamily member 4 [Pangasianodon hypophthalmus]|uniref:tumor necrosis factor receptor superfamily member 4 n=1 Tax=Pangasianodon hypophthalmus TaxID=310915 RepID=UPI000F00333C|nr:tumor necrosis factor receptor superfamily member 4 [Pangasianodon hypophthalmus]